MKFAIPICMAGLLLSACSSPTPHEDNTPAPSALVTLATAQHGPAQHMVTVYGQVDPSGGNLKVLAAPIEAVVAAIDAPVGSHVAAGQTVVRLQPSPATHAQWQAAIVEAHAARLAFERSQRLRSDGLGSDADIEAARARATTADTQLSSLQSRISQLQLRADGTGSVQHIAINVGDLLPPGAAVASIATTGKGVARFGIDPALATSLQPGAAVRVQAHDGIADYFATVHSISMAIDPQTKLASVLVIIPAQHAPTPGQPLSAEITVASVKDALLIPYAAVLDDGGQPYLFVVTKSTAWRRDVRLGPSDGRHVAIIAGLKQGEQVVVAGATALDDGMRVRSR